MNFFKQAGWYVIPTLSLGMASLIVIMVAVILVFKRKVVSRYLVDTILFIGFISLTYALVEQISGFIHVAGVLHQAPEISPSLALLGLRISFINPATGLVILIYSAIGWFVLRSYKRPAH
ncbi:MAG: hypothetical protein NTV01_09480 [Bacteroidia bacterium]|nr:hypothetical protein [Bacteroidia bacterium]